MSPDTMNDETLIAKRGAGCTREMDTIMALVKAYLFVVHQASPLTGTGNHSTRLA